MATPIIDHNLLTLDYWQDSVTYEGKTVPGGTIGCEALNIPDTLREKLAQASIPLQKIVAAIKDNNLTAELLRPAKGSVLHMIQLAKDTPPFSRADAAYYNGRVEHIFSEEGIQNTLAYVQAAAVMKALAKSKLEKALQDNDYAQGSYAAEMEQAALLAEAKANRKR